MQTDPLFIESYASVDLWGRIGVGTRATVVLDQPPSQVEAEVTVIDPIFDAASGTFGIRLDLPNPDSAIPAGQRCQVTFDLAG